MPVLIREEAVAAGERLKAEAVLPHFGAVFEEKTSVSTARPLRFLVNDLLKVASVATANRMYR